MPLYDKGHRYPVFEKNEAQENSWVGKRVSKLEISCTDFVDLQSAIVFDLSHSMYRRGEDTSAQF